MRFVRGWNRAYGIFQKRVAELTEKMCHICLWRSEWLVQLKEVPLRV